MVDKAKWAARWADFKTKAGATKAVWLPPKPAPKPVKKAAKKTAKKTAKKATPRKHSR